MCRVTIMALTGDAFDDMRKACSDAGMDAFVSKPVSTAVMIT